MEFVKKSRRSMQRTLVLSTLAVHLAVLTVTLLINWTLLVHLSEKRALRDSLSNLEYVEYQMDGLLSNLEDIRRLLLQNSDFLEYLRTERRSSAEDVLRRVGVAAQLQMIVQSYSYLDSITVFQWNGRILNVGRTRIVQSESPDERLPLQSTSAFQGLTASSDLTWGGCYPERELYPGNYYSALQQTDVAMLLPLVDIWSPEQVSVLSINISRSYFNILCSKNVNNGSNVYLFAEDGAHLMDISTNGEDLYTDSEFGERALGQNASSGSFVSGSGKERSQVIYRQDSRTGWLLVEEIPYSIFLRDMMQLQTTTALTFALSIIVVVCLSSVISRRIMALLGRISGMMADIGEDGLNKRLPEFGYTELDTLTEKFNSMMEQLQNLAQEKEGYEREKRELEIEALQAQINPHFIYNSLTTIRWMASMARAGNVCQAILALNNVLQPVFSQTGILWPLDSERIFVENFMDIMNYRFGGEIRCIYEIPMELEKVPVLRFLLQPAVENAITHGLRGRADGLIQVRAQREGKILLLVVEDNGCGMPPEVKERLNSSFEDTVRPALDEEKHGFGLYNINRRIKLHYGFEYGLSVSSEQGRGTQISIRVPPDTA